MYLNRFKCNFELCKASFNLNVLKVPLVHTKMGINNIKNLVEYPRKKNFFKLSKAPKIILKMPLASKYY